MWGRCINMTSQLPSLSEEFPRYMTIDSLEPGDDQLALAVLKSETTGGSCRRDRDKRGRPTSVGCSRYCLDIFNPIVRTAPSDVLRRDYRRDSAVVERLRLLNRFAGSAVSHHTYKVSIHGFSARHSSFAAVQEPRQTKINSFFTPISSTKGRSMR